jgi:hypothetical protein
MQRGPFALPTKAAIFGQDTHFNIPFIADWKKIGEHRQRLTDLNTAHENKGGIDYDYKVGQKVLVRMMVSSVKQNLGISKNPGQLCQSIQMEQSCFNVETNVKG